MTLRSHLAVSPELSISTSAWERRVWHGYLYILCPRKRSNLDMFPRSPVLLSCSHKSCLPSLFHLFLVPSLVIVENNFSSEIVTEYKKGDAYLSTMFKSSDNICCLAFGHASYALRLCLLWIGVWALIGFSPSLADVCFLVIGGWLVPPLCTP